MARVSEPATSDRGNETFGVDPVPAMRARMATGIFLGVASLVIIVGVPLFLYYFVGSRWPSRGPTMRDWETLHLKSEIELFIGAVSLAAWIIWAVFTLAVVHAVIVTAIDTARYGITAQTWRDAANPARWMAGLLIGAIAALWPTAAHAQATEPVEQATTGRALTDDELAQTTATDHLPPAAITATAWHQRPAAQVNNDTTAAPAPDVAAEADDHHEGRHVVRRGDTLWSIAGDYLGDPMRYMEIYHANQDRTFPDGGTLTDPDRISEGWELLIPGDTADSSDSASAGTQTTHIVGPGDSLWSLAAHYLGDGARWSEIYQANQNRTFTDGRTLSDPDLIIDGWELTIPTHDTDSETEPVAPEPPTDDAELEGEGEVVGPTELDTPDEAAAPPSPDEPFMATPAEPSDSAPVSERGGLHQVVPFGVWLAAGTCLAATTVIAIAARLRKRRPLRTASTPSLGPEQALSGRLSDLEAVIEAENRRLTELDTEPEFNEQTVTTGVGTDLHPIELGDLAPNGMGLLGPGQRAAARAALVAAAAAGQGVYATAAAELDLDDREGTIRITDTLQEALTSAGGEAPAVIVCAESDFDENNLAVFERFAEREGCTALVLGDWEPSAVTLAGDGTVQAAAGQAAGLTDAVLHIADPATSNTILTGLDEATANPPDTANEHEDLGEKAAVSEPRDTAAPIDEHDPGSAQLRLCLFGNPDLYLGDKPVRLKKGRRARTFLAVLALADGPVSRDELFEAVVGDATDYNKVDYNKARSNLNTTGTTTRKNLREATGQGDADFYTYDDRTQTYRLQDDRFTTDIADFDTAEQAAALTTDPTERARHLEAALAVYTDDLAPQIHTDHANELRGQYRAAAHRACRKLADHYTEQGDTVRAERYAAKAASLNHNTRPQPVTRTESEMADPNES